MPLELSKLPKNLDHLVYTAFDLEVGMDAIESLLGVRPVKGGRHSDFGTHNALLSLGPATYLEVIAPDPETVRRKEDVLLNKYYDQYPRLTRWVLRTDQIDLLSLGAAKKGLNLGEVQSGSRQAPNGTLISWKLTNPFVIPFDGVIPFLISWGDTRHPAMSSPSGGELMGFRIEHPNAKKVRDSLDILGQNVEIIETNGVRLIARIKSIKGMVELF